MCGIAGFLELDRSSSRYRFDDVARQMICVLDHRGPDDRGVWTDPDRGVALSHARLSIVDLSAAGHQPMESRCGRFVAVFNGEIYNFRDLRKRLSDLGHSFVGESDTEVLLASLAEWGTGALQRLVGMFAFALWDRQRSILTLARDRLGEKPLYYGWLGSSFVFASELKALRQHPGWKGTIDRGALALFLRHGYVPGPHSIYSGIQKLQPGCFLSVHPGQSGFLPEPVSYWNPEEKGEVVRDGALTDSETISELERLIFQAVGDQMVADVPLGAFLSGGVDSSTVVAIMQAQSSRPVKTFTIGFEEDGHNEAPAAERIARHLGTDHHERYVRSEDALDTIPRLGTIYDEPFADSSQIPTLLISELARQSVTVSLSGDGGDELFAGYPTYVHGERLAARISRVPAVLRRGLSRFLLSPRLAKSSRLPDRVVRLGELLDQEHPLAVHRTLYSHWLQPHNVVQGADEPVSWFTSQKERWPARSFAERMMLADACTYLPDDLLVKVDRAAMAVSLETRVPLLDHRVVEFALRLPWKFKNRDGKTKWILREVLSRHVPTSLVEGPKRGFAVPMADWLRGPLKQWASRLLQPDRLRSEGFFHAEPVMRSWDEHQNGLRDRSYQLWIILMFQQWLEQQDAAIDRTASVSNLAS